MKRGSFPDKNVLLDTLEQCALHAIEAAFKLRSLVVLEALLAVQPRCYPEPRNPIQPLVCFALVFG